MPASTPKFTPTELVGVINQTLEYAYGSVLLEGEVASFKVNQGKWVFFDLKDEQSSVSCFLPLYQLRTPLEDGMRVIVRGVPRLTKWGKFSFTVSAVQPVGQGSLKKAFEMLKKKLAAEGLFDPAKKRPLPEDLTRLGVISSTGAAGYADFIKIINARWGGIHVQVAHTQVQGLEAPDQIIRALQYFNERGTVQMIAILRGGGSADDLACFNDEALVRAIAASKIPVITGIGHEVDTSLADLAADIRASTPSNAAELLTPSRTEEAAHVARSLHRARQLTVQAIEKAEDSNREKLQKISQSLLIKYINPMLTATQAKMQQLLQKLQGEAASLEMALSAKLKILAAVNPENVLAQGYAILSGKISPGSVVKITTIDQDITAEVKNIAKRSQHD